MRVTQKQLTRTYLDNSHNALDNMTKINNRVLSQRKFLRASEDSVGAAKALIVRRNLEKCEMYTDNLNSAKGIFETAEKSMLIVSDIVNSEDAVYSKIIKGVNGTEGEEERKIIAEELRNKAKQMISQMNTDYSGRQLFGGSNNSTPPYAYDETTGELTYNGLDINTNDITLFPNNEDIYTDVGMGIKFDAAGNVDKQTVMNLSLNGAEILGYGTDANGNPNNLIAATLAAADALESGDSEKALELMDNVKEASSKLMIGITNVGNMEQSVEFNLSRVEDEKYNLQVAQQTIEGVDLTEEITNYKVAEMAYNATLQMGGSVIPRSIFDFI